MNSNKKNYVLEQKEVIYFRKNVVLGIGKIVAMQNRKSVIEID